MFRAVLTLFFLLFFASSFAQSYKYYPAGLGGGSNLRLWLDPSDESTFTLDGFDRVLTITDKTANSYTFSRRNVNFGPFYYRTTKKLIFTKSGESNTAQILFSPISPLSSPASIFKVFRNTNLLSKGVPWSFQIFSTLGHTDRSYIFLTRKGPDPDVDIIEYYDREDFIYANANVLVNTSVISLVDMPPPFNASLKVNGDLPLVLTGGNSEFLSFTDANRLFLGSTVSSSSTRNDEERFDGELGEFFVYSAALNPAQVTLVENYISQKWEIPISNDYFTPPTPSFKYELVGIGQTDATNNVLKTMNSSGGLNIENDGFIDTLTSPQFIIAAHDNTAPGVAFSKPIILTIDNKQEEYYRWSRYWYVDVRKRSGTSGPKKEIIFSFNFKDYYNDDAETPIPTFPYYLIYSSNGTFTDVTTALKDKITSEIDLSKGTVTFSKVDVGDLQSGFYTLASNISTALNFEFKNLKAELNNRTLTISWEVDNEDDIDSYFIEKSIDGINFEPIVQTYSKDVSTNSFGSKYITLSHDCSAFYWRLVYKKKMEKRCTQMCIDYSLLLIASLSSKLHLKMNLNYLFNCLLPWRMKSMVVLLSKYSMHKGELLMANS